MRMCYIQLNVCTAAIETRFHIVDLPWIVETGNWPWHNFSRRGVHGTLIAAERVMTFQKWAGLKTCGWPQRPQVS